jgi:hypothetical protein
MGKLILSILLLVFSLCVQGGEAGVVETNFKASVLHTHFDDIGNSNHLRGEARFPIANYTGLSLMAGVGEFNGKSSIDSSDKTAGVGVFLRKYDLGAINANYIYSESKADTPFGSFKSHTNGYSLSGTYYIDKFDISLARGTSKSNPGATSYNYSSIDVAYYASDNLRLSVSANGMDSSGTYSLDATYQPKIFNNDISIIGRYVDSNAGQSYMIGLSYYFGTKASLIDRNRKY